MSENLQNATTVESETVQPNDVLPSEEAEQSAEVNPYDMKQHADENGKLAGKFDSADELLKSYNEAQEYIQKINAEKAQAGNEAKQAEFEASKAETVGSLEDQLRNEFIAGEANQETIDAMKEAGKSEAEIKVIEYETKEAIQKIVDHVGSMEQFNHMKEVLSAELTDAEKMDFNSMIGSAQGSELAMLGLEAKYNKLTGGQNQKTDRVRGKVSNETVRGYTSYQEMSNDLAKLRANPNNKALQTAYQAKMNETPMDVVQGRR